MSGIKISPFGTIGKYEYVVMLSRFQGRFLLSRHKGRTTWEMQGGHIEPGETPEQAAGRELYEESGAADFDLIPLCDYSGEEPGKNNYGRGKVFRAEIRSLDAMPFSEMAEVRLFDEFPDRLTYPEITHAILAFSRTNTAAE